MLSASSVVLIVAFAVRSGFYVSLELIHHIGMDIMDIYTFQGMQSPFTTRQEICFSVIKAQALISQ